MELNYSCRSLQGALAKDNRDCCGVAKLKEGAVFILVDGATSSPNGGELAKALLSQFLEKVESIKVALSCDHLVKVLKLIHADLRRVYPADSASYIIAIQNNNRVVKTLHAGDCRLGRLNGQDSIQWLTRPHTLANALHEMAECDLKDHPNRHLLTRSFKGRRFQVPEVNEFELNGKAQFVLATDGFWAVLSGHEQIEFMQGKQIEKQPADDASCLLWQ